MIAVEKRSYGLVAFLALEHPEHPLVVLFPPEGADRRPAVAGTNLPTDL